ncbi:MAG TPA: hypothetical protein VII55_00185 [Candidatus Saccharimonadales bacterium]
MSGLETASTGQTFYEQNREGLDSLFSIVGLPELTNKSLPEVVAATQPWVKGDHARPEHSFSFGVGQTAELNEIYGSLGLRDAHELPPAIYDHTIVLGGVHRGNNRRLEFLGKALTRGNIITRDIMLLGGERRVYPEVELDTIEGNLDKLASVDEPWLDRARKSDISLWWETDLLRLAARIHLGPLTAEGHDHGPFNTLYRPHLQQFNWRNMPLAIMHTRAISRQGEPRHTTEACMRDWLNTAQPTDNATVAFVAANPHMTRMGRSARAVLRSAGRSDIDLVVAGPASPDYVGHNHYLGEIARHLYEDQRLLEA